MKQKSVITIISAIALLASPVRAADTQTEIAHATLATAGGAAAGGITFAAVGSGGMVIAGTALSIGAAPIIAAGAIVGLAGYGFYRIFN
jgi:hypothetical protein